VTIEEVMEMDSVPLSVRAMLERRHTSRTTVGAALADEEERKARAKAKSTIAPGASEVENSRTFELNSRTFPKRDAGRVVSPPGDNPSSSKGETGAWR
jgi:hypothetical protein